MRETAFICVGLPIDDKWGVPKYKAVMWHILIHAEFKKRQVEGGMGDCSDAFAVTCPGSTGYHDILIPLTKGDSI